MKLALHNRRPDRIHYGVFKHIYAVDNALAKWRINQFAAVVQPQFSHQVFPMPGHRVPAESPGGRRFVV